MVTEQDEKQDNTPNFISRLITPIGAFRDSLLVASGATYALGYFV